MSTKIKICGITNLKDAVLSVEHGADALGFNFYEKSPRYILPQKTRIIIDEIPEDVLKVGVFVNETIENIISAASVARLDAVQLHGEETPEFIENLRAVCRLEIIKAFRVSPIFQPSDIDDFRTDAILLDAYNAREKGGTGETFDWEIACRVLETSPKMYLAGGLSPENIAEAIARVKPFGVDACSCLESTKGEKDAQKLKDFLANAQNA